MKIITTLFFILYFVIFSLHAQEKKIEYWENGKIKSEKEFFEYNGITIEKMIEYFESGKKSSEKSYRNKRAHGTFTYWYESGKVRLIEGYLEDSLTGLRQEWYPNGKLKEECFINGQSNIPGLVEGLDSVYYTILNGSFKYFYENGNLQWEFYIKNGLKEGKECHFFENGNKKQEGYYLNDKRNGIFSYWDNKGKIIKREVFLSDKFFYTLTE